MSDGSIFRRSNLKKAVEDNVLHIPEDCVLLGDSAFPLTSYLMTPYSRLTNEYKEKVYNYRHCRARRVVKMPLVFWEADSEFLEDQLM